VAVRRPSGRRSAPSAPSGGDLPAVSNDAKVIVPKLNADPIWSLRPWPVVLNVVGEDYEIPAMPAVDWLVYLMQPEPDLDGLLSDHIPDLDDLLIEGLLDLEELYDLALDLVATVCARPWWVALRLIQIARQSWDVLGPEMVRRRIDAERHSIAAWLDTLLVACLNSMEPKDTTMFTMQLEAEPIRPGETAPDLMDSMQMDRGAFEMMGRM